MSQTTVAPSMSDGKTVVQVVNVINTAVATGTTLIPFDDTIPQKTEGDEYITLAITPSSASNILIIEVALMVSHATNARTLIAALFQDSTAGALATGIQFEQVSTNMNGLHVVHRMVAGTASETTFKVRIGSNGSGTTSFNGFSGARKFGGVSSSSITITEYEV